MKILSNEQLDAMLDKGGNTLQLKLAMSLQYGTKITELMRQLRWRWASRNVFTAVRGHFKQYDHKNGLIYASDQWYNVRRNSDGYDNHLDRILEFLLFIRDYRKADGSMPPPAVALKAWRMRFNWFEMVRRCRIDGVAIDMGIARKIVDVEKYFRRTNEVDAAIALFIEETTKAYTDWALDPNPNKRKTPPQFPTERVIKRFKWSARIFATIRDIVTASRELDWFIENEMI